MKKKVLTEEHKQRIREGMRRASENGTAIGPAKGTEPWNKGMSLANGDDLTWLVPMTEDRRKRISEAKKGVPVPEERRKRISQTLTGKRLSEECKRKISASLKGVKKPPRSKEHCANISKANKGRKLTAEWIRKSLTRHIPTSMEMEFDAIVKRYKLPYRYVGNGEVIIGGKNPDFINTNGAKIAVEVYYSYYKLLHHKTINDWKRERRRTFRKYGWEVVFFDENQLRNEQRVVHKLKEV